MQKTNNYGDIVLEKATEVFNGLIPGVSKLLSSEPGKEMYLK